MILSNFPLVSQLTPVTSDGRPSENAQNDCTAASIGACILWYQGKNQWDKDINPDMLKDASYPSEYTNGTAAIKYVSICEKLGFKLYPFNGIPGQLVSEIHKQLQQKHPVIVTVPDVYVAANLGWSHVLAMYGEPSSGHLVALDPYIAKPLAKSDQEWTNLLLYNQIWIVEPLEEDVPKVITIQDVSTYFVALNDHQWQCKSNGKIIQYGILSAYKAYGNGLLCGLSYLGLPVSNELPLQGVPGAVKQHFERGVLCYDPAHKIDNPPGWDEVYPMHLYNGGPGQDPFIAQLEAKIAALQKTSVDPALLAAIEKVKADVAALP